jgi:hypothetical protein
MMAESGIAAFVGDNQSWRTGHLYKGCTHLTSRNADSLRTNLNP